MITILLTAFLAAILSSICTILLAHYLFEHRYKQQLEANFKARVNELTASARALAKAAIIEGIAEANIDEQLATLEGRVKRGVIDGIKEANLETHLAAIEGRVRAAVVQAATDDEIRELLDQWANDIEDHVRQGVTKGIANIAHPDVIRDATINVTEVSSNLITEGLEGLNNLLGGRGRNPRDRR